MIRLAVVDDQYFVRLGIRYHFAHQQDVTIVGAAAGLTDLDVSRHEVDVLLIDFVHERTPSTSIEISSWAETTAVLVMSDSDRESNVIAAVRAGARGYLVKDAPPDAFVHAVQEVASGGFAWSAGLADTIQRWLSTPRGYPQITSALSVREREVLGCLAWGLTHRQIATRLEVAQSTVDTYVKRIRTKLNLGNKAELTRYAMDLDVDEAQNRHGDIPAGMVRILESQNEAGLSAAESLEQGEVRDYSARFESDSDQCGLNG